MYSPGEIRFDHLPRRARRRAQRTRRFVAGVLALGCSVTLLGLASRDALRARDAGTAPEISSLALPKPQRSRTAHPYPFEPLVARTADAGGAAPPEPALDAERDWTRVTVAPGDNLSLIFARHGLSASDLHRILAIGEQTRGLQRLQPGQQIALAIDEGGLQALVHLQDGLRELRVVRDGDGFRAELEVAQAERRTVATSGVIDSSLFIAGQEAGLSDAMILELAEIFGWDIDFVLDIRAGDRFAVVYEELRRDGRKVKDGPILAAEFTNRGRTLRAIRYVDAEGRVDYYSEDGRSMRKAFLRTPVNFTRISSRFNLARRHPVLNTIRAHRGVDYAAPHGTPVKATGDGKVVSIGRDGGYGNVIVLKHGGSYSTVYAHLSRFSRGLRRGHTVRQGQTIGYVGSTGLATGPHLHYEFRVGGVHKDPLKVELPPALPIPERYRADFRAKAAPLLAELERLAGDAAYAEAEAAPPGAG